MPIQTSCSGCGQVFQAPDAMAGRSGKCPKCGEKLQVPLAAVVAAAGDASSTSSVEDPVKLPDITGWADEILGELPANAGAQQSGATQPIATQPGPPGSTPSPLLGSTSSPLSSAVASKPSMTAKAGGGIGPFFWKMLGYRWYVFAAIAFIAVVYIGCVAFDFQKIVLTVIITLPALLIVSLGLFPYVYQRTVRLRRSAPWGRPGDPTYISPWGDVLTIVILTVVAGVTLPFAIWFFKGESTDQSTPPAASRASREGKPTSEGYEAGYQTGYKIGLMMRSPVITFPALVVCGICSPVLLFFIVRLMFRSCFYNACTGRGVLIPTISSFYLLIAIIMLCTTLANDPGRRSYANYSGNESLTHSHGNNRWEHPQADPRIGRDPNSHVQEQPNTSSPNNVPPGGFLGRTTRKSTDSNTYDLKWNIIRPGIRAAEVTLSKIPIGSPGHGMRLFLYKPDGSLPSRSTPCVFIAPAGSNGLHGMHLAPGDRPEHYPYVQAGMIVVGYEVDGALPAGNPSDAQFAHSYQEYKAAEGGLSNARLAMKFALQHIPEVDPEQFIAAGHSSAANLAIVWGGQDQQISKVVALAPVVNMFDQMKDSLGELSEIGPEFKDVQAFVRRMSPDQALGTFQKPLFIFQAEDDPIADLQATTQEVKALQVRDRPVTFESVPAGGHHDAMVQYGLPAAIKWLGYGLNEGVEDSPVVVRNSNQTPPEPTGPPPAGSKTSTPSNTASSQRDYGAADYDTRKLPHIKSALDDARLTRIDFMLGSDEAAISRMRWSPGRECPDVLTLWSVGLSVTGTTAPGELRRARDLRDFTGPIGESIVDGIVSRSKLSQFGEWPLFSHSFYAEPMLLSVSKKNLADFARKAGADCLVHLNVEVSFVGLNRVRRSSIVCKVIDLHGDIPEWESTKLSSRSADEASTSEFSEAALLAIDENYLFEPVNESLVNREWVMQRVRDLLQQRNSDALVTPPLAFLCELRYYLARNLMTKAEGEKTCDLFFGSGSWNRFFEGGWESRKLALQNAKYNSAPESTTEAEN